MLSGENVRDVILTQGKTTTQSIAFFVGNLIKDVQEMIKSSLTVDSGRKVSTGIFKASKDFAKGDTVCTSLWCISIFCETVSGVLVWCPIPAKIPTVAALKATPTGCIKFRDLCSEDPFSPLC